MDERIQHLVAVLRELGLDAVADSVAEHGICGAPNPFSTDLPSCMLAPGHYPASQHKASWPELVDGHAGLGSMEWDSAGLDELRRRNERNQEIANRIRAEHGLDPLEPPDLVTGYQRRPPDAYTPKDATRFQLDVQTDAVAERFTGQFTRSRRGEEDGQS